MWLGFEFVLVVWRRSIVISTEYDPSTRGPKKTATLETRTMDTVPHGSKVSLIENEFRFFVHVFFL